MRVIAGTAKGRKLETPNGLHVRPTLDRVRESLFNILGPRVHGSRFLDLFAGTGANGIEALSRNAALCTFVDHDTRSIALIRRNLSTTALGTNAVVYKLPLPRALPTLAATEAAFDIVFADPPFEFDAYGDLLEGLETAELVANEGVVIIEHATRKTIAGKLGGYSRYRAERYGEVTLTFFS